MEFEDIELCQKRLLQTLGSHAHQYFEMIKSWFKKKITKKQLDDEAIRLMISPYDVSIHNEFLLKLISYSTHQAQANLTFSDDTKPRCKRKKIREEDKIEEISCHGPLIPCLPHPHIPFLSPRNPGDLTLPPCALGGSLPSLTTLYPRLLLASWEAGLDTQPQGSAALLILKALEQFLLLIIQSLVDRRKASNFYKNPYLTMPDLPPSTSYDSTSDVSETFTAGVSKSTNMCGDHENIPGSLSDHISSLYTYNSLQPISLYDLLDTLQTAKWLIPSHSVYVLNVERIICLLDMKTGED